MDESDIANARGQLEKFSDLSEGGPLEQLMRVEALWELVQNALKIIPDNARSLDRLHDALTQLRLPLESVREQAWELDSELCHLIYSRELPHDAARVVITLNRMLTAEIDAVLFCLPLRRNKRLSHASSS